jgi:CBS domain-containing protein
MQVRELLRRKSGAVVTVRPTDQVSTAARLLMQHNVGGLPVVAEDGSLRGFVSERDIVRGVHAVGYGLTQLSVERIMSRPAPTCSADDPLQEVMSRMTRDRLRHLIVLEHDRLTGVISVGDLVKHRLEQLETEANVLRDYVSAQRASS